jgi:hypothetical protein
VAGVLAVAGFSIFKLLPFFLKFVPVYAWYKIVIERELNTKK